MKKDIQFTVKYDSKAQQIISFEKLKPLAETISRLTNCFSSGLNISVI